MKRTLNLWVLTILVLMATVAFGQSLADVARNVRKEKTKSAPSTVYTNDNLPGQADNRVPSGKTADSDQNNSAADAKDGSKKTEDDQAEKKAEAGEKKSDDKLSDTEKLNKATEDWRNRITKQKETIALLQRELDVLQREYRLRAAAYYADAGNALRNQKQWADSDRDYRSQIEAKQKELDAAKQKLEDMKEEARQARIPESATE
jgi:hypothetical protein